MSGSSSTFVLVSSALGVAVNLIGGTLVQMTKVPLLFLDTIGTMFTGAAFGPLAGVAVGFATNLVQGVMTNPKDIPFALVNMAVGLIVGLVARKGGFSYGKAFWTGLALAVVCPLVGTPIAVWIYGGITGGGLDFLFAWLKGSGAGIFTAAFLPRIAGNLVDKIGSALLVAFLLQRVPARLYRSDAR
ncbi:MAG: CD3073 family putative ECF transporter S component [Chitinophagales bacterium]